jgi:choice-of-anchor B domain-containing protein
MQVKKLLTLLLILPFFSISQVQECTNNLAGGIYPCNDYDLMSNIPISVLANTNGNPEGSDVWGWTDPLNGNEYAIIALTNSTAFVNITNPVNPVFIGRLDSNAGNNYWRDVKVYNNFAFIVADNVGSHGMQVFDLKRLRTETPLNQTFSADSIYTGVGSCHNIVINESEAIAYLVGCSSTNGGGPIFIDLSEFSPTSLAPNPTANFINDYTAGGYSHDAQVVTYTGPDTDYYDPANGITDRQIYIGSNGNTDKVVILDVTDKNNIIPINSFTYTQTRYAHQGWFTDDQKYFIMGDEVDEQSIGFNTKTIIFDFTDLDIDFDDAANSGLTRFYFGPERAIDHNGYVKGNEFFLANYRAGMRVLDISNIDNPSLNPMTEIGYFDTYPASNSANFNGAWSVYPYFNSGNIIISDIERGLFVVRKSNTLSTQEFNTENSISLSPNPAKSYFSIKSNTTIKSVRIYNILGQIIFKKEQLNTKTHKINTLNITKGVYLVKINNQITKKLIVE